MIAHKMLAKAYPTSLGARLGLAMIINSQSSSIRELLAGSVVVRDSSGSCFRVSVDDPRYLSGELVHVSLGRVTVIDQAGITKSVTTKEFSTSSELKGVVCSTVTVKDVAGKYYRVPVSDGLLS